MLKPLMQIGKTSVDLADVPKVWDTFPMWLDLTHPRNESLAVSQTDSVNRDHLLYREKCFAPSSSYPKRKLTCIRSSGTFGLAHTHIFMYFVWLCVYFDMCIYLSACIPTCMCMHEEARNGGHVANDVPKRDPSVFDGRPFSQKSRTPSLEGEFAECISATLSRYSSS